MAQIYNNFRILNYDIANGTIELAWYDDTVALNGQNVLLRNHRVPIEFETEGWDRAALLVALLNEVESVPDLPQWIKDEANKSQLRWQAIPVIIP